jgi:hypothetical protein
MGRHVECIRTAYKIWQGYLKKMGHFLYPGVFIINGILSKKKRTEGRR